MAAPGGPGSSGQRRTTGTALPGGDRQQPHYRPARNERRLALKEWRELIRSGERFDDLLFVDALGATLLTHVRLHMVRRTAGEAIRHRTDCLRRDNPTATMLDDADAAADRLAGTLGHMDTRQGEGVEPAARAIATLTHGDYAGACFEAQDVLGPAEVVELVIQALRLPRHDINTSMRLIMDRVSVVESVRVGALLGERHWWPKPLKDLAVNHVRSGRTLGPLVECLDGLGFSNLSPMQQRAALRLLTSPANPYGMDPNAIAAVVRGVSLLDDSGPVLGKARDVGDAEKAGDVGDAEKPGNTANAEAGSAESQAEGHDRDA